MKHLLRLALILCIVSGVNALEVSQGEIRLTLDEPSSRFLMDLQRSDEDPIPLLFSEDPRTSGLDIREGNRVYRMGDGGEFRQVTEQTDEGIFYVWTSSTLRVAQRFRFVRSADRNVINGVQIDISITNLGERSTSVGARLLLDTYLGERSNSHFTSSLNGQITGEAEVQPSDRETFIRSGEADSADGLQVMISGPGITTPDQVAVANWKRLSDSDWQYVVNSDRNFNRLPYSINDSAVLLTYADRELGQNDRYEIVVQMGGYAPGGYLPPEASRPVTVEQRSALIDELSLLLARIDALIADPDATAEEVAELREELEALSEQVSGQ